MKLHRLTHRFMRDGLVKTLLGVSRNTAHRLLEMRPSRRRSRAEFARRCEEFDRVHHVQTSGMLRIAQRGGEDPLLYGPIDQDEFHAAFRHLDIDARNFDFIDIGSGKGKGMFLAAEHPFRRIIGIELCQQLHAASLANIRTFQGHLESGDKGIFSVVCTDATTYEFAPRPTVLFLFNPFGETIMRRLVANVEQWCARVRQPLYVVYVRPHQAAVWREAGFNDVVYDNPGCVIFRKLPDREVHVLP